MLSRRSEAVKNALAVPTVNAPEPVEAAPGTAPAEKTEYDHNQLLIHVPPHESGENSVLAGTLFLLLHETMLLQSNCSDGRIKTETGREK